MRGESREAGRGLARPPLTDAANRFPELTTARAPGRGKATEVADKWFPPLHGGAGSPGPQAELQRPCARRAWVRACHQGQRAGTLRVRSALGRCRPHPLHSHFLRAEKAKEVGNFSSSLH